MTKRILLIEDDLDIQRIYSSKLTQHGYEVPLAVDATQGLLLTKDLKPNLILLDIMLPGKMNGLEFLERIKQDPDLKDIPVVVLTNLDTEKEGALKIGVVDYLLKASTNLNELVEKVEKYAR